MGAERISRARETAPPFGFGTGSLAATSPGHTDAAPASDLATIIVELAPDGILIVDMDGTISFANPAAAAIFGHDREDMNGLEVEELVPECLQSLHARHRRDYGVQPSPRPMGRGRDLLARRGDGTEIPVEISLSPISVAGRPATIAVVRVAGGQCRGQSHMHRQLLVEEDERIATELHDRIIKRLFLAGMKIQSVLTLTEAPVYQQLNETVDQLDMVIREIRHTVFAGVLAGGGPERNRPSWS